LPEQTVTEVRVQEFGPVDPPAYREHVCGVARCRLNPSILVASDAHITKIMPTGPLYEKSSPIIRPFSLG